MIGVTNKELREQLHYDPETGDFTWLISKRGPGAKAGHKAGCIRSDGYVTLKLNQKLYLGHRLAWEWVKGPIPAGMDVDHIDNSLSGKGDNRISNLRLATRAENLRNAKRRTDNVSGVKGVSRKGGKWRVVVEANGHRIDRTFKTKNEAVTAVRKMREEIHGEFARHA